MQGPPTYSMKILIYTQTHFSNYDPQKNKKTLYFTYKEYDFSNIPE